MSNAVGIEFDGLTVGGSWHPIADLVGDLEDTRIWGAP